MMKYLALMLARPTMATPTEDAAIAARLPLSVQMLINFISWLAGARTGPSTA
jgi:hypothetical protein